MSYQVSNLLLVGQSWIPSKVGTKCSQTGMCTGKNQTPFGVTHSVPPSVAPEPEELVPTIVALWSEEFCAPADYFGGEGDMHARPCSQINM